MEVSLRRWRMEDAPRVAELADNEKIERNLRDGFPFPYTLEDARSYIGSCLEEKPDKQWLYAICVDGRVAGSIGVFRLDNVYRRAAEIGYWLGESYWGKAVTARAVKLICREVLETSDIVRIEAGVFDWNSASCRVLEKAGFNFEGRRRKCLWKNGTLGDCLYYALIAEDKA